MAFLLVLVVDVSPNKRRASKSVFFTSDYLPSVSTPRDLHGLLVRVRDARDRRGARLELLHQRRLVVPGPVVHARTEPAGENP